jgi:hypothetical protein
MTFGVSSVRTLVRMHEIDELQVVNPEHRRGRATPGRTKAADLIGGLELRAGGG